MSGKRKTKDKGKQKLAAGFVIATIDVSGGVPYDGVEKAVSHARSSGANTIIFWNDDIDRIVTLTGNKKKDDKKLYNSDGKIEYYAGGTDPRPMLKLLKHYAGVDRVIHYTDDSVIDDLVDTGDMWSEEVMRAGEIYARSQVQQKGYVRDTTIVDINTGIGVSTGNKETTEYYKGPESDTGESYKGKPVFERMRARLLSDILSYSSPRSLPDEIPWWAETPPPPYNIDHNPPPPPDFGKGKKKEKKVKLV